MQRYLKEAYRIDPRDGAVNILLGNERLAQGQVIDAVAYYEIAKQSPGTSSLASWNLALAYSQMGRADKVSEQLKTVSSTSTQAFETGKWLTLIDEKVETERRAFSQRTRLLAWVASSGFAATLRVWTTALSPRTVHGECIEIVSALSPCPDGDG